MSPQNAIYIGDNPYNDVTGDKKIGMSSVLVNRTSKEVAPSFEPDYSAANLRNAWEWIRKR